MKWNRFRKLVPSSLCRKLLLGLAVFLASPLAGCKGNANLLLNPGFERGSEPWYSMKTAGAWGQPFDVSDTVAHSGDHSAHLQLVPPATPTAEQVFGAVQDLPANQFPEFISGYYRVENWQKATPIQYLQFVVIAFTTDPTSGESSNTQIRYLLAGIDTEPFDIENAKFVFLSKADPPVGEWVYFERNVKDDFVQLWGGVPQGLTHVRMFFEARYDSPTPTQPQIGGDVYYDDLYAGPQADAPKHQ